MKAAGLHPFARSGIRCVGAGACVLLGLAVAPLTRADDQPPVTVPVTTTISARPDPAPRPSPPRKRSVRSQPVGQRTAPAPVVGSSTSSVQNNSSSVGAASPQRRVLPHVQARSQQRRKAPRQPARAKHKAPAPHRPLVARPASQPKPAARVHWRPTAQMAALIAVAALLLVLIVLVILSWVGRPVRRVLKTLWPRRQAAIPTWVVKEEPTAVSNRSTLALSQPEGMVEADEAGQTRPETPEVGIASERGTKDHRVPATAGTDVELEPDEKDRGARTGAVSSGAAAGPAMQSLDLTPLLIALALRAGASQTAGAGEKGEAELSTESTSAPGGTSHEAGAASLPGASSREPYEVDAHTDSAQPVQETDSSRDPAVVTCEIALWNGYLKSRFYARLIRPDGTELAAAESGPFRNAGEEHAEPTEEAKAALDNLLDELIGNGWTLDGTGPDWYSRRLWRAGFEQSLNL